MKEKIIADTLNHIKKIYNTLQSREKYIYNMLLSKYVNGADLTTEEFNKLRMIIIN